MGRHRLGAAALAAVLALASCNKDSVVAPSGSAISLSAAQSSLNFNGSTAIVANVTQASGQSVPDGTVVAFKATFGSLTPTEAPTAGGKATTTFVAGGESGTAEIGATSGSLTAGAIHISIGAAAAARLTITANPTAVPFNGGTTTVTANVVDAAGNPLSSVGVAFAATAGSLAPATIKTDANGNAVTRLTTAAAATVTASIAGQASTGTPGGATGSIAIPIAPQPVPVVAVVPGQNPTALLPTTFTITVTPAANSNTTIQNVSIAFGDGARLNLGTPGGASLVAQHVYAVGGTYTVTVTATDSAGAVGTANAPIVVAPQQPLGVAIAYAQPIVAGANTIYTFTATVQPAAAIVASYLWEFGDGGATQTTTANQVTHSFRNGGGPYTIKVTILTTPDGKTADAFTIINP